MAKFTPKTLYCITLVHILDAIKQILPFLAFVSFLMFYDYTAGDGCCLSRLWNMSGKIQGWSTGHSGLCCSADWVASAWPPNRLHRAGCERRHYLQTNNHPPLWPLCCGALTKSHLLTLFSNQGSVTLWSGPCKKVSYSSKNFISDIKLLRDLESWVLIKMWFPGPAA